MSILPITSSVPFPPPHRETTVHFPQLLPYSDIFSIEAMKISTSQATQISSSQARQISTNWPDRW